jgi:hypothetical protein
MEIVITRSGVFSATCSIEGIGIPLVACPAAFVKDGKWSVAMEANHASAHRFSVDSLSGNMIMNLFSTHPPSKRGSSGSKRMK